MKHIESETYFKCLNCYCQEVYKESEWQKCDYRCPECNNDEYTEVVYCNDCDEFINPDDIIDGWHVECAKAAYNEQLAIKYISWQAKQNVADKQGNYDVYNFMKEVQIIYEFIVENSMSYQDYAFDDMECWIGFLNDIESHRAQSQYNVAAEVASAIFV